MHVAVIDIGEPGTNLGWAMSGAKARHGTGLDECIEAVASALAVGPVALGFEAPLFVPLRSEPSALLKARNGECQDGINRPFSAGAGATVLVIGLVVVPYVLMRLRSKIPQATATLDWRSPISGCTLLLFEAFVTNQRKTADTRHVEDARLAVAAFERGMHAPATFRSSVTEPHCLNLLGAMLLRTGWTTDLVVLSQPCLVVRA